jgi:hypothetical protein
MSIDVSPYTVNGLDAQKTAKQGAKAPFCPFLSLSPSVLQHDKHTYNHTYYFLKTALTIPPKQLFQSPAIPTFQTPVPKSNSPSVSTQPISSNNPNSSVVPNTAGRPTGSNSTNSQMTSNVSTAGLGGQTGSVNSTNSSNETKGFNNTPTHSTKGTSTVSNSTKVSSAELRLVRRLGWMSGSR